MWLSYSIVFLLFANVFAQKAEGDSCLDDYTRSAGRCTKAESCQSAQEDYQKNGIRPTFCSYTIRGALICCRDGNTILDVQTQPPQAESRPIWGSASSPVTRQGRKRVSERKCSEYSQQVVQNVDFIALVPDAETMHISAPKCKFSSVSLIVGGENASLGEFPHMAAIGWASSDGGYIFPCGGSLISPRFVLTAGHCIENPRTEDPKPVVVRLGDQNIDNSVNDGARPVEIAIRNIIPHPEYQSPVKYNDIALIELSTDVDFESNIRPACLWLQPGVSGHNRAIATGWGVTKPRSPVQSKELQKVSLSLLENDYCDSLIPARDRNRNWQGFVASQLCAGELRGGMDTCQGDSGSPLQVTSADNQCIYYVLGITSFGKKCATAGQPSIYTRVSSYIDWIESVVWPGE